MIRVLKCSACSAAATVFAEFSNGTVWLRCDEHAKQAVKTEPIDSMDSTAVEDGGCCPGVIGHERYCPRYRG